MLFDRYTKLVNVVPEVPEILLESCSTKSSITRERIIQKQRIITIIPLIHEDQYPNNLIPPRRELFSTLHISPNFSSNIIMPQQLQFITFLVSFIKSHPDLVTKALEMQFSDQHNNLFVFMCYSAIPAFFGFFSSSELVSHGFSFYCSLVSLSSNERLIDQALIPFFCNSCTFRYIEMIFYQFGIQFCHDSHLETKQIQKDLLRKQYLTPLIDSIIQSYPLIPHTHKFLLKYMISNGRNPKSVLHFFLHRFTFPQLLRYFKQTSFTSHFIQLKSLMISLRDDITPCLKIIDIFDSPSLFEVPSMFTVFDSHFTQLLLTSADVHVMMKSLEAVCELPACLKSFRDTSYFTEIKFVPFWVKVFSRNPRPPDSAFNWRRVVFSSLFPAVTDPIDTIKTNGHISSQKVDDITKNKNSEKASSDLVSSNKQVNFSPSSSNLQEIDLEPSQKAKSILLKRHSSYSGHRPVFVYSHSDDDDDDDKNKDDSDELFERIYLEISSRCSQEDVRMVSFLTNSFNSVSLHNYHDHVMKLLDPSSLSLFIDYVLSREVKDLIKRSKSFEQYLVHSLSLQTMVQFSAIVSSNYTMMVIPIVHGNMQNFLKRRISPTAESIQKVITDSLDGIVDPPVFVVQTLFMMAIQHVLNLAVPSNLLKKLNDIEKLWENHLLKSNERVMNIMPKIFQTTPLLNRKLRETIEHLKCIKTVKFEWSLNLILESLSQFDEMIKYDNIENSIIQFALVSCSNVSFISKFIIINIFVVRQEAFKIMVNENRDTYLWSRLESTILKLLASDEQLLTQFVILQDELSKYQIA